MVEGYWIYNEDGVLVGELSKDMNTGKYKAELINERLRPKLLFGISRVIETPESEAVELWIKERVFPETRENARQLLDELGLRVYDFYEIFKKTQGRSWRDGFYVLPKYGR